MCSYEKRSFYKVPIPSRNFWNKFQFRDSVAVQLHCDRNSGGPRATQSTAAADSWQRQLAEASIVLGHLRFALEHLDWAHTISTTKLYYYFFIR